jgi:inner membrane protein
LDNLTHTLIGAALAESGLKRRTALGATTLMIGANFPDIDVVAVFFPNSVFYRRGVTHGFLALVILPFVLAGIMWAWDQSVRRRRRPDAAPADFQQLAILSGIAMITHPTLDFMNTYGMRWLMPFVDRWFYADGLFIIDLWILIALGFGVFWARRARTTRPARVAIAFLATYTVAMLLLTGFGRSAVERLNPGRRFMVAPIPLVPWQRHVLIDEGDSYREGSWSPFGGVTLGPNLIKGEDDPAVGLAKQDPAARRFLQWARFPYYQVIREGSSTVVAIVDARYGGAEWASLEVRLP